MIQKVDYFKADDGEVFPSEQEANAADQEEVCTTMFDWYRDDDL